MQRSTNQSFERFKRYLLESQSSDCTDSGIRKLWNKWSATYDEDTAAANYKVPDCLATILNDLNSEGNHYLDIGCGTGLIGKSLKATVKSDFVLDGCDVSEDMLKAAEQKDIYRNLISCGVDDMPFPENSYDIAVSGGVFGKHTRASYPNADSVPHAIRVVKPGGYFVFSLSATTLVLDGDRYYSRFDELPVSVLSVTEHPYHELVSTMKCIVLQKSLDA
ncbi:MAG: class I SAM-dependent methyltransferase [Spirulina sp. SIO3F2]|nr:class I SAM-dependent methyltransferase [Spirulina sp. SIO3F2]